MPLVRDYGLFPGDENGDVLWRMFSGGDDFSRPREIEFFLVFPEEEAALDFAVSMLREGFKVSASPYKKKDVHYWQVGVYPVLKPSHIVISGFETMLEKQSRVFGGKNDGWGCFES